MATTTDPTNKPAEKSSDGYPVVGPADANYTDAQIGTSKVSAKGPRRPRSPELQEMLDQLERRFPSEPPPAREPAPAREPRPTPEVVTPPAVIELSRGRSEARPATRRPSNRSSRGSPDDPDSEPPRHPPLAGPSPRFSRPWRPELEALLDERRKALRTLQAPREGQLELEGLAA
jgi:hypothetical protein